MVNQLQLPNPDAKLLNLDAVWQNLSQEATRQQCQLFMNMVQQSVSHNTIRSYLKLYTTIPMSKLADFLGWSEEEFQRHILSLKHHSTEQVNSRCGGARIWPSMQDVALLWGDSPDTVVLV